MKSIKRLIFAAAALLSLAAFSSCTKSNDSETFADVLKGEWNITRWYGYNSKGETIDFDADAMAGDTFKYSAGKLTETINGSATKYTVNIPDLVKEVTYSEDVIAGVLTDDEGYVIYAGITFKDKNHIVITQTNETNTWGYNYDCTRK